jgi:hypothetical protein
VTVTVCPATVSVPVRDVVEVFAATVNATVPLPVPELPLLTVIHAALLAAVHVQPVPAVTPTDPLPPADVSDAEVVESVKVQGAPACVTVTVFPAIVSVPEREVADVFAATVNATVPLPVPELPPLTVIQAVLLAAVHVQPLPAVTPTAPLPAADVNDADEVDSV